MELLSRDDVLEISKGQVTSENLFIRNEPDPNGLFSREIFGSLKHEEMENFGHIELNTRVFHPHILMMFKDAYRKEFDLIYKMKPYTFTKEGQIKEIPEENLKDFDQSNIFYGIRGLIINLHRLQKKETKTCQSFWQVIDKNGINKITTTIFPVIPVGLRPYHDAYQYDEINDIYINLLKSTKILESQESNSGYKYSLSVNYVQKYLLDIYNYIQNKISKKQGLIRQALLGKRLDFSGRSVATVDPNLKPDEVGIPIRICVSLFEPWILREIVHNLNMSIPDALEVLQRISKGMKVKTDNYNEIINIIKQISNARYVLVNRAPNLHRGSIKAYKVVPVDDNSIHFSPVSVSEHNLDFDGDSYNGKIKIKIKRLSNKTTVIENKYITLDCDIMDLKNVTI